MTIDVLFEYPVTRTEPAYVGGDPDLRFDLGLRANLELAERPKAHVLMFDGLALSTRALGDFQVAVWEAECEFGWRWGGRGPVFTELGLGPHLVVALPTWYPAMAEPALGSHVGLGAAIGRGDVRGIVEARGGLVQTSAYLYGAYTRADGTHSWSVYPASARVDLMAGAQFR